MQETKLTKAVRPGAVVWISLMITLMILGDGNIAEFTIKEVYVPLVTTLAVTIYGFFFTSRGVEKTAKIITKEE